MPAMNIPVLQTLTFITAAAVGLTVVFAVIVRLGWRRGKSLQEP
jgi:hypothetical protein